ncbi:porin PorA family protein [Phytohabitans rumicis]|uniref:DUF3068 domain-containing protein n=1 Tax=Phytohabitans rumicis TaxID=1076125 RepID=A0A6V8LNB3_9ACTN|nr:porin PorA family protein [Phytohabitans rumicis]GFJ95676.1 hypothetical protein Prum_093180 [Phytohabitans rumicis]
MRKARALTVAGAAVLIAASAAVRFVAVPALVKLPADLDTSVRLSGTASLVDMAAIAAGDLGNTIRLNIPVTVSNRVRVTSTRGDTAIVLNESTVEGPGNATLQTTSHTWAIDRRTFLQAPAPPDSAVQPHTGLVLGFPLPPEPKDYPWWDFPTQTVVPARYRGTEQFAGRQAHVYTVHADGQVKDPVIVRTIPAGTPVTLTSISDTTFWVDTVTAVVLNVQQKQVTRASIAILGLTLPPITVFTLDASYSPESAATLRDTASTADQGLFILRTVIPLVLLGLGLALAALAIRARYAARTRTVRTGP